MRVPQPDIIEHFGNADAVPQPPERHLELCGIAIKAATPAAWHDTAGVAVIYGR